MTREFKVGDKVFDLRFGNGEVRTIDKCLFPIYCSFNIGHNERYLSNGKDSNTHKFPILFHGHDLIIEVKEAEYEWQVMAKFNCDGKYSLSEFWHKSVEDFRRYNRVSINDSAATFELFEPSKRLVKRG